MVSRWRFCSSWWRLLFVVVVSGVASDGVAVSVLRFVVAVVVVVAVPIVAGCSSWSWCR